MALLTCLALSFCLCLNTFEAVTTQEASGRVTSESAITKISNRSQISESASNKIPNRSQFSESSTTTTTAAVEEIEVGETENGVLESATTTTLREVLHGPLRENRVTLLVGGDVDQILNVNKVLSGLAREISVLQAPGDYSSRAFSRGPSVPPPPPPPSIVPGMLEDDDDDDDGEMPEGVNDMLKSMIIDVLVVLVWQDLPDILLHPPESWRVGSLLMISLRFPCQATLLFESPLASRTPSVALLCPWRAPAQLLKNLEAKTEAKYNNKESVLSKIIEEYFVVESEEDKRYNKESLLSRTADEYFVAESDGRYEHSKSFLVKTINDDVYSSQQKKTSDNEGGVLFHKHSEKTKVGTLSPDKQMKKTDDGEAILIKNHDEETTAFSNSEKTKVTLFPDNQDAKDNRKVIVLFYVLTWLPFHPTQRLQRLGYWNHLVFREFTALFTSRFRSMGGKAIHVSSDNDDAPLLFQDEEDEKYGGTCKQILEALSNWMNFTYTLTPGAPDLKWGELDDNGTWVGLLGEVYRGNKDLAINYFTITHERAQYFDYSVSYLNEGFGFALPVPPELPRWRNLVYPFTWAVWAGVGGMLGLTCCSYYVIFSLQAHPPPPPISIRLNHSLLGIVQGIMNQPQTGAPPASWSLRVFLALWWLTAYILCISYTSNLIAVLTIPIFPARIDTLEQLARSPFRLCMLDYGEFVPEALATSSDKVLRTLGGKMDFVPVTDEGYYGQEDCAELVLEGKNAHIETLAYLQITYADMELTDRVYFMREQIYEGNLAFFYRKHTPWRHLFDEGMRRLIEAGFVPKWQRDIMLGFSHTLGQPSSGQKDSNPRSLSLGHLQGAFLVLLLGLSTSFVAFVTEWSGGKACSSNHYILRE
ncbi:hypothetical protein Pmani_024111 [Petrolisthes manimaculis]|uniref:Ionotropic glutamate receptor L-glutamate and glycine-binding domain-containing protein n=1 Tax=Petrolisthes manimaculis TaxID=1843537 RepID=A0AAE1U2P5_9EUCA|nr:hypothetical protein Pmani_024111 [Petrolisthes manimaculis]